MARWRRGKKCDYVGDFLGVRESFDGATLSSDLNTTPARRM
jgi:hypothetical protein